MFRSYRKALAEVKAREATRALEKARRKAAPDAEWVYTSTLAKWERDMLLQNGWEMVDSSLVLAVGVGGVMPTSSEYLLRHRA